MKNENKAIDSTQNRLCQVKVHYGIKISNIIIIN